jgi:Acyl-CoA dehydrogenase, C-terminal domain
VCCDEALREDVLEWPTDMVGRGIPHERVGEYAPRGTHAVRTHLQLAEATVKLDQAQFHARRAATTVDEHIEANLPWDIETRVRCRIDVATSIKLARRKGPRPSFARK